MRRVFGRAALHNCDHCGAQAKDWAQIHDTCGECVKDYMPLCRSCHTYYDVKPDSAEKRKQSLIGVKRSDETRAKMSAAQRRRGKCSPDCLCGRHFR